MSAYEGYKLYTRHILPGPQDVSYFIPMILLPASLLVPRTVLSRWQNIAIFMPLITLFSVKAWQAMDGVDVISMNVFLWATFLIALEDPWRDYRLVHPVTTAIENDQKPLARSTTLPEVTSNGSLTETLVARSEAVRPAVIEQGYPSVFIERLTWVRKLLAAIKLDNWKVSRVTHDRVQPLAPEFKSRRDFLKASAYSLLRVMLIIGSTSAYIKYDTYFTNPDVSISAPLPFVALRYIPPQLVRSMVAGAQAYAAIGEYYYPSAAILVILNGQELLPDRLSPHTWPAHFGSPLAIFDYGVRGFWGSFWHQTMRWTTSGPGYAVADLLHLRGGMRYTILSLSAFGFSGLVHMGLVPPEPIYAQKSANVIRLYMAGFFWLQPIAILVEVLVAKVFADASWKQGRRRMLRRMINGIWTILWFTMSLPVGMEAARQLGYWNMFPVPFDIWTSGWLWIHGQEPAIWSEYKPACLLLQRKSTC